MIALDMCGLGQEVFRTGNLDTTPGQIEKDISAFELELLESIVMNSRKQKAKLYFGYMKLHFVLGLLGTMSARTYGEYALFQQRNNHCFGGTAINTKAIAHLVST